MNTYNPATLKKILRLFKTNETLGVTQLSHRSGLSRTILHKYVKTLVGEGELKKVGAGPHTKYKKVHDDEYNSLSIQEDILTYEMKFFLDNNFLKFTPRGSRMLGYEGFIQWCKKRDLDIQTKADAYLSIYEHLAGSRHTCGLLSATKVFNEHVVGAVIDELYYADQYKRMDFGRGKLAELTFYAKQSQRRKMIRESIDLFLRQLQCLIYENDIDALAFVPWSIQRENQLLGMLDAALYTVDLPRIVIKKFYEGETRVPQKSLKKREDRIENARETIYVRDDTVGKYKHILLIDDFVGSGATLNETAKKLKACGVSTITGFAIVGNLDLSYDVINEV